MKTRTKIVGGVGGAVVAIIIIVAATSDGGNAGSKPSSATKTTSSPTTAITTTTTGPASTTTTKPAPTTTAAPTTTTPPTTTAQAQRTAEGAPKTLGAGTFTVGTDIEPGVYTVTAAAGQSGNLIVNPRNALAQGTNEILGVSDGQGVAKVRVPLYKGDKIEIDNMSDVRFTPVPSGPYVTAHKTTHLYAGTWVVGQDIGAGRYVATTVHGESGNFIVTPKAAFAEGANEILGVQDGQGVPSVTVTLHTGDVISISGLNSVTMTATGA